MNHSPPGLPPYLVLNMVTINYKWSPPHECWCFEISPQINGSLQSIMATTVEVQWKGVFQIQISNCVWVRWGLEDTLFILPFTMSSCSAYTSIMQHHALMSLLFLCLQQSDWMLASHIIKMIVTVRSILTLEYQLKMEIQTGKHNLLWFCSSGHGQHLN